MKFRIFLAISLVVLGVLLARVFIWPLMGSAPKYSEISRESLIETANGWILQFDITNHASEDARYNIYINVDGKPYQESCQIVSGGLFTYIHQIPASDLTNGEMQVKISKDGEGAPFEQGTYYLR
ncbi:MAG: hypothetical protein C4542_07710 [Dehalococcoidia bacterium]|nr:MAG: hypothetical protein C4542_07710 [Dehalococcoidia bacterium]